MPSRRSEVVCFGAAARSGLHGPLARLYLDQRFMESELMEGFIPADLFEAVCHLLVAIFMGFCGELLIERVHLKRFSGNGVCHILFVGADKLQQIGRASCRERV